MTPISSYAAYAATQWQYRAAGQKSLVAQGSLAKVDLSGFTRLSERLARSEMTGAEGLNTVLNDVFVALIEEILNRGGDVLQFGGDALLVWFEGTEHERRAVGACMAMQRRMRERAVERTVAGPVRLRMSAGVATGPVVMTVVGRDHRELLTLGPTATRVEMMERDAASGEVLVDAATAAQLPTSLLRPATQGAWCCRGAPEEPVVSRTPPSAAGAEEFVPPDVRSIHAVGVPIAEHRRSSVAFIGIAGIDSLIADDDVGAALSRVTRVAAAVDAAVDVTKVAWTATDVMQDGAVFLLFAGAPITREDDEERLLRACRVVVENCADLGVRVGAHAGRVFAADIGHPDRRTYAIIGDTTNLAARLMHRAAPGTVVVSEELFERSDRDHVVGEWQDLSVKGRSRPVRAGVLGARTQIPVRRRTHDLPLIGRESERSVLTTVVDSLTSPGFEARPMMKVGLVAEAGTGKSRLIEDMIDTVRTKRVTLLRATATALESETPYGVLRPAMRGVLDLTDDPDVATAQLSKLTHHPQDLLPLLGLPLGLDLETTPRIEAIDPRFLESRRNELLADVLIAACSEPLIVVIEDLHDLDRASVGLLDVLSHRTASNALAMVVTSRLGLEVMLIDAEAWMAVRLEPLGPHEARRLALAAAGPLAVSDADLSALVADSGGNPLFLRELVALGPSVGAALPTSTEGVIAARIDTLGPARSRLLREASVAGLVQRIDDLAFVLGDPSAGDPSSWAGLSDFVSVEPATGVLHHDRPGTLLRFRHDLYRQCAYAGLALRRRRALHAGFADHLMAASESGAGAAAIAVHLHEAQRHDEAWRWALQAARATRDTGSLHDAVPLFRRAVDAGTRAVVAVDELANVQEELGDIAELIGRYDLADEVLRSAARVGTGNAVARRLVKRAAVVERQGRYRLALSLLTRAEHRMQQERVVANHAVVDVVADPTWTGLLLRRSSVLHRLGRPKRAYGVAAEVAATVGSESTPQLRGDRARALLRLEMIASEAGWSDRFDLGVQALAAFEGLDEDRDLACLLGNIGVTAWESDDWSGARLRYEESVAVYRRAGDVVGAAIASNNAGEILCEQGHLDEARGVFHEARRVFRAAGHSFGVACTASSLGRVAARTGHADLAAAFLAEALASLQAMGSATFAADAKVRQVEAGLLAPIPGALRMARDLTEELRQVEVGVVLPLTAMRYFAIATASAGNLPAAQQVAQTTLESAVQLRVAHEESLLLDLLAGLQVLAGAAPDPRMLVRRDALWHRLGVVDTTLYPPIPRPGGDDALFVSALKTVSTTL